MAKRRNGEGSIYQRKDGRWTAVITLDTGKRKQLYGPTRAAVAAELVKLQRGVQQGEPVLSGRYTFAEWLDAWIEGLRSSQKVKLGTLERYEQYANRYLRPAVGKTVLTKLTAEDLNRLYADALRRGLAPRTVRHLHAVARNALNQALRKGHVARNVALQADPPRARRTEMHTLTREQAAALLKAAQGTRLEALFVVALSTGAREGELLALHWKDVELDVRRATITIRRTLRRTKAQGLMLQDPKTKGSHRVVPLSDAAVSALRRHKTA